MQSIQSKIRTGFLLVVILLLPLQTEAQDFTNIKNAKPFSINGNIGINSVFYGANGNMRLSEFTLNGHTFNLGVNYISNTFSDTETSPSYNETRGEIRYGYTF